MTDNPRRFASGPVWGQSHLALDALVAFVDDELSPGARRRALAHLAGCGQCGSEVVAQTQARLALRTSSAPSPPSSLLSSLRAIPVVTELPAPAGLGVGPVGELVPGQLLRPETAVSPRPVLDRRLRIGAGALVSGLALSALVTGAVHSASPTGVAAVGGATGLSMAEAQRRRGGETRDGVRDAAAVSRPAVHRFAHHRWYR